MSEPQDDGTTNDAASNKSAQERPRCGLVMPISAAEDCTPQHWGEVLLVLREAVESAGFSTKLVSDESYIGVIHHRIIQNVYENPIVVCDVSTKNPNVMFELGLRLAFDKPVIIVKDDKTDYTFDIGPIEHLEYPRSLRYSQIIAFKERLAAKVKATCDRSNHDADYSPYLGSV